MKKTYEKQRAKTNKKRLVTKVIQLGKSHEAQEEKTEKRNQIQIYFLTPRRH
jgi:hypothetical protein